MIASLSDDRFAILDTRNGDANILTVNKISFSFVSLFQQVPSIYCTTNGETLDTKHLVNMKCVSLMLEIWWKQVRR
jgi:hypothetical protein